VFFDGIHYLVGWEVHLESLVDTQRGCRFVATGSAAATLEHKSAESGAGRFGARWLSRRPGQSAARAKGRCSHECCICSKTGYMPTLAHQLFGQSRSAVLGALLLHPEASLDIRELARLTGASAGSLHRELRLLADMGMLLRQEVGRQVHYRANAAHPIHAELAQLLRKTAGLVDVLREVIEPLGNKVALAFVYGSMASGTERAASDVDLMVLGRASFVDLVRALAPAQVTLRRDVNPTVMTRRAFARMLSEGDGFARTVARGDKPWIKGEERDLAKPAEGRSLPWPNASPRQSR
jgi:predicted nucleotidyltransferase